MKSLHRPDLYGWSAFDLERNIDFNSIAWIRPEGNVLIDPMPMTSHDFEHLTALGGAAWVVVTNSDHARASRSIADVLGAKTAGPQAECHTFSMRCDRWLSDGDAVVPGLTAIELHGSKTPGELALLLHDTTLITGDLIRAHQAGQLMLLPDAKLQSRDQAIASVKQLAHISTLEAVLVGDGWSIFRDGAMCLQELIAELDLPR